MMRAFIAWRGRSALDQQPIRVQVVMASTNRKTGDMVQTYVLRDDMSPVDAMRSESDSSVCGDCPLSGLTFRPEGGRGHRACYVNVGRGPQATWKPDTPEVSLDEAARLLTGRSIRLGAYGDPAAVPIGVWTYLLAGARRWTGYTHQWPYLGMAWRHILMASVDSEEQALLARSWGWRTFRASADGEPMAAEIVCPNTTHGVRCIDCGLCDGADDRRRGVKSIVIPAHGPGRKHIR